MKDFLYKLYMLMFMCLTVLFIVVIWKVTFAHIVEEYHQRKEAEEIIKLKAEKKAETEKSTFQKIVLDSEERVKTYLGYKILEEKRIKGHFHHIGFDIGPDNRSYCIMCHGDMPHDDIKELRAFLNMHSFFISCQTCHVSLQGEDKTNVYKWYDRTTGEIIEESPVKESRPGSYTAKILPFVRIEGKLQAIDTEDRRNFAREFKEKETTLTEAQKSKAKKIIHQIVSKQPHICEACHQTASPLLPLETLGYPQKRIDSILSTEVVGMIKKYTDFYMPKMLQPGESKKKPE